MNTKLAAWLLTIPILAVFALPFVLPGNHVNALQEGLFFSVTTGAVGLVGMVIAQAVRGKMSRREAVPVLLAALGALIAAIGFTGAVRGRAWWIALLGIALFLVGLLGRLRQTAETREAEDTAR